MTPEQRSAILAILQEASDLTLATVRADGWPQANTVSYVNDGLDVYFGTSGESSKARNMTRDGRVSATIDLPYSDWSQIRGLSFAAVAERVAGADQLARVSSLILQKFPQTGDFVGSDMTEGLAVFRLRPVVFSILDYRRGFGWCELIQA
jgi:hypothetical protein